MNMAAEILDTHRQSDELGPRATQPEQNAVPSCLAYAMLEWALEQTSEVCQELLCMPTVPGHDSKVMVPSKLRPPAPERPRTNSAADASATSGEQS